MVPIITAGGIAITPDQRNKIYGFLRMIFTEKPDKAFLNNFRQEEVIDVFSALNIDLKLDELSEDRIEELEKQVEELKK